MAGAQKAKSLPSLSVDQFYREVGSKIRAARLKLKEEKIVLTQEGLAGCVGLTRTSLVNIEKGRQKLLLHTFAEIAVALGVEPADLLPKKEQALNGLAVNLPTSLAPEERGFIERAISTGGAYEKKPTTIDQNQSKRTTSKK